MEHVDGQWLIKTDKGDIRTDIVVNAAGQWSRQLGRMVGLELPIIPLEHHHPMEYQRGLYDLLMAEGEQYGMVDWGYRALDSMRLEKAYRLWGADMSADWTPLQAGMERFVDFDKGDFIGREALLKERAAGSTHTLACMVVDVADADVHGFEPVFSDGEPIAYVASGGYGHTLEKSIAFSYLPIQYAAPGTVLDIGILGERRSVEVVETPLYDPNSEKLLG